MIAAEIEDVESFLIQGPDRAVSDVIDIGKVPCLVSVSENRDCLSRVHVSDKLENAHVRSAGGTIYGEISQDGCIEAVEIIIRVAQGLSSFFCGRVRGQRGVRPCRFFERHL